MAAERQGLDHWLDFVGFADAELDPFDTSPATIRAGDAEDPWADATIDVPRLTEAQRSFLLGDDDFAGPVDDATAAESDALIIDIPTDPDEIEPFER